MPSIQVFLFDNTLVSNLMVDFSGGCLLTCFVMLILLTMLCLSSMLNSIG